MLRILAAVAALASQNENDWTDAELLAAELAQVEIDVAASPIAPPVETGAVASAASPAPCNLPKNPPLVLLYASVGGDDNYRFLIGCPGEVVVGEKRKAGPGSAMKTAAAHKAGGRTAYVMSNFGLEVRNMLKNEGVDATAKFINKRLDSGYDYVVIDEITAHPDWKDGSLVNRRFRQMLLKVPARKVIAYVSLDLTMRDGGAQKLRERKYLMRALKRRGRVIALEVYLHTDQVMAGQAGPAFKKAADRLAKSVKGLKHGGGINKRAITVVGVSMHSQFPQYRYLDRPSKDLASLNKQGRAIEKSGSKRVRQQRGIGWYFVNRSDITPSHGAYTIDGLIRRMRIESRRWRD